MSSPPITSIPLTTTFTPSPSCLSNYYWTSPYTHDGFISLGPPSTTDCLPSGWEGTSQHFSPALCPSGYVIACEITTVLGIFTETQATCCPSGYACQTGTHYPWFSTEACARSWPSSTLTLTTITSGGTFISTSVYPGYGGVNAYGVSIRWQSTDFPATVTQPTKASTSDTTSTVTVVAGGTSGHGLTSGAAAGIGVGATLIFIAVIAFVALFVLRRRRRRGPTAEARNAVQRGSEKYYGRHELGNSTAQSASSIGNDNGMSTRPADGLMYRAEGGGHGLVELPEQGPTLSPNSQLHYLLANFWEETNVGARTVYGAKRSGPTLLDLRHQSQSLNPRGSYSGLSVSNMVKAGGISRTEEQSFKGLNAFLARRRHTGLTVIRAVKQNWAHRLFLTVGEALRHSE